MSGEQGKERPNKLKLGIFGANMDGGMTATKVKDRFRLTWPNVERVARAADEAGFEALLPMMRWKSMGGETDFHGTSYEPFTWAAGVSSVTDNIGVYSTMHIFAVHPLMAAKHMATIDHISGGRYGFNLVCGWFPPEYQMFGIPMPEHDERYAYAAEWLEVVDRLWTSDEPFDFNGKFFQLKQLQMKPKPVRRPRIMNAGASETGARFAAEHADMAFIGVLEHESEQQKRANVDRLRNTARDEFGRDIEVWSGAWVLCRPTEEEAQAEYRRVLVEEGDYSIIDSMPPGVVPPLDDMPKEEADMMRAKLLAGFGSIHLVGTPEQVADKLEAMSAIGLDGIVLTFVDYEPEIANFTANVMPLLEQRGLRNLRQEARVPDPV